MANDDMPGEETSDTEGATIATSVATLTLEANLDPDEDVVYKTCDSHPVDASDGLEDFLYSVCKVHSISNPPEHSRPWMRHRTLYNSGSGFVVQGRRIITNAHCIDYASTVKVQRYGHEDKSIARVLRLSNDCDVAVLTVEDDEFWMYPCPDDPTRLVEIPHFSYGPPARLQDTVRVLGYPVLGSEISISQGVVSRIQLQTYWHSSLDLLCVQTDGSVKPGNSGGPVLNSDNLVVGIAFQSQGGDVHNTDRVGEFIPFSVFQTFLENPASNGEVIHLPCATFHWQMLESRTMRVALGLEDLEPPNNAGIYVTSVQPFGNTTGVLHVADVIVEINGIPVGNYGEIPTHSFRNGFSTLFTACAVGDTIHVGVVRDRERMDLSWVLEPTHSSHLVPMHDRTKQHGLDPQYVIIGGIVFVGLTSWGIENEIANDCSPAAAAMMRFKELHVLKRNLDEECVIVSQLLDSEINSGYEGIEGNMLQSFNGVDVNSVSHLGALYEQCDDEYIVIKLHGGFTIYLNTQDVHDSVPELLTTHNVPAIARFEYPAVALDHGDGIVRTANEVSDDSDEGNTSSPGISVVPEPRLNEYALPPTGRECPG